MIMAQRQPWAFSRFQKTPKKNTTKIGRREIALDGLQVAVEAVRAFDDRNPRHGDHDHDAGRDPAHADDLALRGLGPEFFVDVHREERRAGVEHAGERSHQRGEQARHHDAAQAGRQQMLHHQRERALGGVGSAAKAAVSAGTLSLLTSA